MKTPIDTRLKQARRLFLTHIRLDHVTNDRIIAFSRSHPSSLDRKLRWTETNTEITRRKWKKAWAELPYLQQKAFKAWMDHWLESHPGKPYDHPIGYSLTEGSPS